MCWNDEDGFRCDEKYLYECEDGTCGESCCFKCQACTECQECQDED